MISLIVCSIVILFLIDLYLENELMFTFLFIELALILIWLGAIIFVIFYLTH
jgi:hypothetical protein